MIRRSFWVLVSGSVLGLMVLQILGWAQNVHPVFDSFSHFRLHFASLSILLIIVLFFSKRMVLKWAAIVTVGISLWLSSPYLPGVGLQGWHNQIAPKGKILRVVQMNLRFNNQTPHEAVVQLQSARADVLLLQEVTLKTQPVLTAFEKSHPFQLSCEIRGVGSVAIVSKHRFKQSKYKRCARFFGYASVEIAFNGQTVTLASFHSRWPWPYGQRRQLDQLQPDMNSLPHPLILAGDFNSAPWSGAVKRVMETTKTDIAKGVRFTWAPRLLDFKKQFGGLLPIDHLLISPELWVKSMKVLGDGGSDHFPVVSELILKN